MTIPINPINPIEIINKATEVFDDNFESEQEAQAVSTKRLEIDLSSPYKLPHLIRPIITIWAAVMWSINIIWVLALASKVGVEEAGALLTDPTSIVMYTLASTTGVLSTCVGFYFHSRRKEKQEAIREATRQKMNKDKLEAALDIETMTLKTELLEEKIGIKQDKKDRKLQRRQLRRQPR